MHYSEKICDDLQNLQGKFFAPLQGASQIVSPEQSPECKRYRHCDRSKIYGTQRSKFYGAEESPGRLPVLRPGDSSMRKS